ncbi:unnamed protein product [Polarella glacialis]|uniref:Uncharacterized protein n=1 Tax=Polarella glacialis TaxID=89957 RepID=A0A813D435_POLGL|nr:unnamed protein product [Polarella glacialis]
MRNNLLLSLHGRTFRTEPCPEGDRTLRARTYCWLQQGHQLPLHRIAGEAMPLECVAGPKMSQAAVLEEPLLTEGDAAGKVNVETCGVVGSRMIWEVMDFEDVQAEELPEVQSTTFLQVPFEVFSVLCLTTLFFDFASLEAGMIRRAQLVRS